MAQVCATGRRGTEADGTLAVSDMNQLLIDYCMLDLT